MRHPYAVCSFAPLLSSIALLCACSGQPGGSGDSARGQAGSAGSTGTAGSSGVGVGTDPASGVSLTPLIRRLTRDELNHTLQDVLGVVATPEELARVPEDRPLEGFVNTATSQSASPEHVAGYAALARALSARLDASVLVGFASCQDASRACLSSHVSGIGLRLFRRPLDAEELAVFTDLSLAAVAEQADFVEALRTVLEAMLQAPQFLYRLELETAAATGLVAGQTRRIGGYEMATRLSYLLWESAPDSALLSAAAAGTLDETQGVKAELTRMLQSGELVTRATRRFLRDWAKLDSLPESALKGELISSLLSFYADFIWTRRQPLLELFTARHAFLTPTLAQNYGLTPAGDGILEYDLSSAPGRLGLLMQPGFIAGMTNADGGAIVARGLFLQSQLFCGDTPSPPESLQGDIDAFVAAQPPTASARQIADVRLQRAACAGCHQSFDPLAYGLEQLDYQGQFRTVDQHGNSLNTDGWIPARFNADQLDIAYANPEDYMRQLSQSPAVGACLVKQHLQHAIGRRLGHEHDPVAAELFRQVSEQGGTHAALLAAIIEHGLFRELRVE